MGVFTSGEGVLDGAKLNRVIKGIGHVYLSSGEAQGKGAVSEDARCQSHEGGEDGDLLGEDHFDEVLEFIWGMMDGLSGCLFT